MWSNGAMDHVKGDAGAAAVVAAAAAATVAVMAAAKSGTEVRVIRAVCVRARPSGSSCWVTDEGCGCARPTEPTKAVGVGWRVRSCLDSRLGNLKKENLVVTRTRMM